jgi:hypothetical protein
MTNLCPTESLHLVPITSRTADPSLECKLEAKCWDSESLLKLNVSVVKMRARETAS